MSQVWPLNNDYDFLIHWTHNFPLTISPLLPLSTLLVKEGCWELHILGETFWAPTQYTTYTISEKCSAFTMLVKRWHLHFVTDLMRRLVDCREDFMGMFDIIYRPEICHHLLLRSIVHIKYLIDVANLVSALQIIWRMTCMYSTSSWKRNCFCSLRLISLHKE